MNQAVNPEPGNGSSDGRLPPVLILGIKKLIEPEVEKSENRVLRAIDALGQRMDQRMDRMEQQMDKRLDRMDERLGTLETGLFFVKGAMGIHVILTVFILWTMKGLLAA